MLERKRREEGVVAFKLKNPLGWIRYRDENPVPTNSLAVDLAKVSSRPVTLVVLWIILRTGD